LEDYYLSVHILHGMKYDLKDKVALVTGGSRGLGAAISKTLAASGAKVAVNYHSRAEEANQVRTSILNDGGVAEIFKADVTDELQVKQLCHDVEEKLGPIDILVVNATLVHVHKPVEELCWRDAICSTTSNSL
jgi:3-oxoacyl-[acyl-carrier protein] reductase